MNYEKYSKSKFESCSDKAEISRLLRELDSDIAIKLKETIESKMEEIVSSLNQQGHSLQRNESIEDSDETDFCEHHGEESCGFRVGSTTTISSGYYGVSELDAEDET